MVLYMMPWVGYLGDMGSRIRSSQKIKVDWGYSLVAEYLSNMQMAWGSTPKEGREGLDRGREGGTEGGRKRGSKGEKKGSREGQTKI